MKSLLLGCGLKRDKRIMVDDRPGWGELTTLDFDAANKPDVIHDLNDPVLPFADDSFDECHAYEVLEHLGTQGDWRFFFRQFEEFYRILKPDGHFCGTVPWWQNAWSWGDPGHTRIITPETLGFLDRGYYAENVYQPYFAGDFMRAYCEPSPVKLAFALKAIKPARAWVTGDEAKDAGHER